MPASSRKKNKGKDRKAKKEESKRLKAYNDWQNWARGKSKKIYGIASGQVLEIPQCNHGLVAVLPDEPHPVSRFLSDYFSTDEDLIIILQRHPELQNNDDYRKMATDILIRIETNGLIEGKPLGVNVAKAILIIENYGKTDDYLSTISSRNVATKCRDFNGHNSKDNAYRDLLKFFRQRINCKCLKKLHLEARKTIPKLGVCEHCEEVKERRLLMVCSRCMVDQYCSRRCQVADSTEHRGICDEYVKVHQGKNDST